MTMTSFELVCKKKDCDTIIKMRAHVVPIEGSHEHDDLGRKETHLMSVVVKEK